MRRISPEFWLCFGFFWFFCVCLVCEILGWVVFAQIGLFKEETKRQTDPFPQFGWGGFVGVFLGPPLGIVSGIASSSWTQGLYFQARMIAALGALLIGGWWLTKLLQIHPFVWIGDFGFAVPALVWAAGLLIFALTAKLRPTNQQQNLVNEEGFTPQ